MWHVKSNGKGIGRFAEEINKLCNISLVKCEEVKTYLFLPVLPCVGLLYVSANSLHYAHGSIQNFPINSNM